MSNRNYIQIRFEMMERATDFQGNNKEDIEPGHVVMTTASGKPGSVTELLVLDRLPDNKLYATTIGVPQHLIVSMDSVVLETL